MIFAEMKSGKVRVYKNPKKALHAVLNGQAKQLWVKGWICIGPRDEARPSSYIYASFASGNGSQRAVLNGHVAMYSLEDLLYILKDLGHEGDKE